MVVAGEGGGINIFEFNNMGTMYKQINTFASLCFWWYIQKYLKYISHYLKQRLKWFSRPATKFYKDVMQRDVTPPFLTKDTRDH